MISAAGVKKEFGSAGCGTGGVHGGLQVGGMRVSALPVVHDIVVPEIPRFTFVNEEAAAAWDQEVTHLRKCMGHAFVARQEQERFHGYLFCATVAARFEALQGQIEGAHQDHVSRVFWKAYNWTVSESIGYVASPNQMHEMMKDHWKYKDLIDVAINCALSSSVREARVARGLDAA